MNIQKKVIGAMLAAVTVVAPIALAPSAANAIPAGGCNQPLHNPYLIGARGSGEKQWEFQGFGETLYRSESLATNTHPLYAVRYPALGVETLIPSRAQWAGGTLVIKRALDRRLKTYLSGVDEGKRDLINTMISDYQADPNNCFFLAGYSQGAMVIHEALHNLAVMGRSDILDNVATVTLIADPDNIPNSPIGQREGTAGANASGINTWMQKTLHRRLVPPIPAQIRDRTFSLCDEGDVVCDFSASQLTKLKLIHGRKTHSQYKGQFGS